MEKVLELLLAGGRLRYLGVAAIAVMALPTIYKLVRSAARAALRTGASIVEEVNELVEEVRSEEGSILEIKPKRTPKAVAVATVVATHATAVGGSIDLEELTVAEFEERLRVLDLSGLLALEEEVSSDARKGIKDAWQKAVDRAQEG